MAPPDDICLNCHHSRQGLRPDARCPECGTLPLALVRPNESQRSFIGLARLLLVGTTLSLFALGASDTTVEGIRMPAAIAAGGASWNWPQLWLSQPVEWRARARIRLGLIMGLWLGMTVSGRWMLDAVLCGTEAPEWLRLSFALVLMGSGVAVGLFVGMRRASRLSAGRSSSGGE